MGPPPLQWHFSHQFLYPIFFNWILHMKRILHFVPDKYIISKSSYNWFKIDTLQLLYDYIKQNTFWQSGNDPKWFLNQFCCWKKLLRHSSPPSPLNGKCHEKFPFSYPFPLTENKIELFPWSNVLSFLSLLKERKLKQSQ